MMEYPCIEIFKTPNNNYVFDANRNKFMFISDGTYEYLHEILRDKSDRVLEIPEEIYDLKSSGFLAEKSSVEEVRHAYSPYLDYFLQRKLSRITLQLTQECNFRCKYCIYSEESNARQRNHSHQHMDWQTAKKAVDFLWRHSVDSNRINIGFYGGEPLLEITLIKKIVDYAKVLFEGKKLTFSMTTNGSLLTDEIIKYLEEQDVILMISLDGPKEINDLNRVFANGSGTYETVIGRIRNLEKLAPEYAKKLSISMVMDPRNDFDCFNSICLDGTELESLNFYPALVDKEFDSTSVLLSDEYRLKYNYQRFLALLSFFNRFPRNEVSPILNRTITSIATDCEKIEENTGFFPIDAPSGPCIPGQLRLFVNVFGQLFPCERVSEKSDPMCIGTIEKGFDTSKALRLLNVGELTKEACKECWCFRYCSLCAKKADDGSNKLSAEKKMSYCKESRVAAYDKLSIYLLIKEAKEFYNQQLVQQNGGEH